MTGRFQVQAIRPDDPAALSQDIIQAFVYTDIAACGLFSLGQVIELQAQRRASQWIDFDIRIPVAKQGIRECQNP